MAEDSEPLAVARQSIVNGAAESGFAYAAAIGDENGAVPAGFCSATLITSRLALSAAHCGDGMPTDYVRNDLRVFFGQQITSYDLAVAVDDWRIHPSYSPTAPEGEGRPYDLSVLVLADDVAIEPAHIRLAAIEPADLDGGVVSIGYGCTTWGGSEFGEKRAAPVSVDTLTDLFLYSLTETNAQQANVCSGDSGGTMLVDLGGGWVQIGVHSEGLVFLGGAPIVTVSDRIDAALPWLLDQVEAVHADRDICQVNQWYGDGICDLGCSQSDSDCTVSPDAGTGAGGAGTGGSAGAPPATDPEPDDPPEGCQCAAAPPSGKHLGQLAWLIPLALVRRRRTPSSASR